MPQIDLERIGEEMRQAQQRGELGGSQGESLGPSFLASSIVKNLFDCGSTIHGVLLSSTIKLNA